MRAKEFISEDRQKLDEVGIVGMGIGGAASYALLAAKYGANPLKWPKSAYAEFALDVGLGAVTGGALTLAKAAAVTAAKTAAKKTAAGAAQKVGKLTGKGSGPGTINKKTGFLRGADGKDTVLKKGDKGFKKAQDQIKKSKQKPDDGIPTMKKEFGKQVKGKGIGKQLSRGVALSPLARLGREELGAGDVFSGPSSAGGAGSISDKFSNIVDKINKGTTSAGDVGDGVIYFGKEKNPPMKKVVGVNDPLYTKPNNAVKDSNSPVPTAKDPKLPKQNTTSLSTQQGVK